MNFEEFIEKIKQIIKENMGDDTRVESKKVLKNNGVTLTGVVILNENQNCVPNIYLDNYFEQYNKGRNIQDIVCEILKYYEEHKIEKRVNMECFSDFDYVKNNLCFRLINFDRNKELLNQVPHIRYLDLAIVFYCIVEEESIGYGNILIRNEHIKRWEADINKIKAHAYINTPKLLKANILPMEDVIYELMKSKMAVDIEHSIENHMDERICVTDEMIDPIVKEMLGKIYTESKGPKMYVASNDRKNFGAAILKYENCLSDFANSIQSDFYILPSSVHELILIPIENEENEVEKLKEMVQEVNRTELMEEEILSDSVYLFKRGKGITKI